MSNWQSYKRLQDSMLRRYATDAQSAMNRFRADEQEAMALSPTSGLYNETGAAMAREANALDTNASLSTPRPPVNNSRYRYTGTPFSPMSASMDGNRFLEGIAGRGDGGSMPSSPVPARPRRPATPMQTRMMGSAGGGGLSQFYQNQRTPNQFQQLQRKNYTAAPTPRQRFTA